MDHLIQRETFWRVSKWICKQNKASVMNWFMRLSLLLNLFQCLKIERAWNISTIFHLKIRRAHMRCLCDGDGWCQYCGKWPLPTVAELPAHPSNNQLSIKCRYCREACILNYCSVANVRVQKAFSAAFYWLCSGKNTSVYDMHCTAYAHWSSGIMTLVICIWSSPIGPIGLIGPWFPVWSGVVLSWGKMSQLSEEWTSVSLEGTPGQRGRCVRSWGQFGAVMTVIDIMSYPVDKGQYVNITKL